MSSCAATTWNGKSGDASNCHAMPGCHDPAQFDISTMPPTYREAGKSMCRTSNYTDPLCTLASSLPGVPFDKAGCAKYVKDAGNTTDSVNTAVQQVLHLVDAFVPQ
jgi:hypothetical protein